MAAESTTPLKVLVAEDEPAMLSLVARHMRSLGFNVVEASDGAAAWRLAQEHHPDLVILDVMMPNMSGWEVAKHLKRASADGTLGETGVIMLTGIGDTLNEITSPLFEADAWLNKPFDFNDLDEKVRETLGRYDKELPVVNGAGLGFDDDFGDEDEDEDEDQDEDEDEDEAPTPRRSVKTAASKKGGAKKTAAKKGAAKKAPAKKGAAKAPAKAPAKKTAAKKAPAKKSAAKAPAKAPAKKTAAKKAPAKAPAKKGAAKKTTAKKGAAKKAR
jgi:DNA-binding response OmpR family regulator